MRKPIVGVMGGSKVSDADYEMARQLGDLIARRGWVLLNGGRNKGVMAASAKGAKDAGGTVVGILPDRSTKLASPDLDIAIVTGLGDGRNVLNVLSSDVVIACPGALGTLSEITLALKNDKHVILLGRNAEPWLTPFQRRGRVSVAETPAEAVERVADLLTGRFDAT